MIAFARKLVNENNLVYVHCSLPIITQTGNHALNLCLKNGASLVHLCSLHGGLEHWRFLKIDKEPVGCVVHLWILCNATQSQAAEMIAN